MNKSPKDDVSELRGVILENAVKNRNSDSRFSVEPIDGEPKALITDTKTGKTTTIPLFGLGPTISALQELFE